MYTADSLLTIRAHSQTEQPYLEASTNKPASYEEFISYTCQFIEYMTPTEIINNSRSLFDIFALGLFGILSDYQSDETRAGTKNKRATYQ